MNKSELIANIARETKLSKIDTEKLFNGLVSAITKGLKKADKITVPSFITFTKSKRSARTGRDPQTGKAIKIAAKNVVKIKAGKTLVEVVN